MRVLRVLVATLVLAACASPSPSDEDLIPQPIVTDIEVADPEARVDLRMPTFSDPTHITNPYFPVARPSSTLLTGTVDDAAFRTEVTVLPTTRIVEWEGRQIETVVSQYAAFLDGRIHEIAYDLYAQADDGSVWYFGEDVYNFADGAIADTHGTWHAGADGPAAMIMPADPQAGDVYRPENIPGLVFEEVVVLSIDETMDGPFGTIENVLLVEEHHADGANEDKAFAPNYGEFHTAADGEVEALAMAVPPDAAGGDMPDALSSAVTLSEAAIQASFESDLGDVERIAADLESAVAELGVSEIPTLYRPLLDDGVASLAAAAAERDGAASAAAAIWVARLIGDLTLRYVPIPEVDLDRIGLWGAQLMVDAATEELDAVNADAFALTYTRERIVGEVAGETLTAIDVALEELRGAIDDEDFPAIVELGEELRGITAEGG